MASDRDEDVESLRKHRDRIREQLREGLKNVSRLETPCQASEIESWMKGEIERFGGRRVELDDE